MTIEERVVQLERELAEVKRKLSFFAEGKPSSVVHAREFVVVDGDGNARAKLGMDIHGPCLLMIDKIGKRWHNAVAVRR
jgi:hypothetical protein